MHNIAFPYLKILEIFVMLILCIFLKLLKLEFRVHVLYGFPLIVGFDVRVR
jgi:hypothetical protein